MPEWFVREKEVHDWILEFTKNVVKDALYDAAQRLYLASKQELVRSVHVSLRHPSQSSRVESQLAAAIRFAPFAELGITIFTRN